MLQHVNAAGTTYAAPHVATLAGPLFACDIGIQRPPLWPPLSTPTAPQRTARRAVTPAR